MSKINEKIKELRKLTSASISDCKKALEEAKDDLDKAKDILRRRGQKIASKKAERETTEGLIENYIHSNNKIGVLLEINCETDFVAKNTEFRQLAHDIAMHIAAMDPQYIKPEEVKSKPKDKKPEEISLLTQPFIKNPEITIGEKINEAISHLGENIQIKRFIRYEVGE